ncbi:MAG: class IV adenylate cyclase [Planctomycetia bacterium]|nr:class IV adenylate cyclase [Planctomycetia bacterium]
MYEVELKFPLRDVAAIERRLVAMAARFCDPIDQVDRYFAHPCRDFARTDEALRLRRTGDRVELTWKGPRIDAAAKTRREIEIELAAPAAAGGEAVIRQWTELLESLGFRRVAEVSKRRRPVRVGWQGTEVDAAIDAVAGLGDFLELEIRALKGEVPLATACLQSLAAALECAEPERRSYLEMILQATAAR